MTAVKNGDRIKVSFEGTVYYVSEDEMGIRLDSGDSVWVETGLTISEAMMIEIVEPPKIPADAEVIRWVVAHDDDYIWRYANVYGHPGNGVWWVPDTCGQYETKDLVAAIGNADVEVLKRRDK